MGKKTFLGLWGEEKSYAHTCIMRRGITRIEEQEKRHYEKDAP